MPGTVAEGHWDVIPYELLFQIFSYLGVENIVSSVQHVCWRWNEVSCDARLWKTLVYTPPLHASSEDVKQFLEQVPQLRHFSLHTHGEADRIIEMLPDYCQDMETLSLEYTRAGCSSQVLLARLLFCLENIHHLEIALVKIDDELLGSFWLAQNLKSLWLKFRTCDSSVYRLLSHVMNNCYSLQELRISFQEDVFDSDLKVLVQKVSRLLTSFTYSSGNDFSRDTRDIFSECASMKSLVINRPMYHSSIFDLKCIGKLPLLENLAILRMNTVPNSLGHLFLHNSWSKLVKLDFAGLKGFDNGSLVNVFRACPELQELNFSDSSLSDEGFQYVCDYSSCLRRVSVKGTGLTDAGLQNLHQCCHLVALSVEDCPSLTGNVVSYIHECTQLTDIDVSNNTWVTGETIKKLLLCPRLEYLNVEFCANVTAVCFESVEVPRNFHRLRFFCTDKCEVEKLMKLAVQKSFMAISPCS